MGQSDEPEATSCYARRRVTQFCCEPRSFYHFDTFDIIKSPCDCIKSQDITLQDFYMLMFVVVRNFFYEAVVQPIASSNVMVNSGVVS